MIPTKNNDIKVDNNLGGVKVAMKFDENSLAHIMSVLTDLYSDPELAVIREYSTNALDSHVAAGQTRPIEISLPGSFSPFFKVKDFGVGMSVSDIESIYSKYGASTKRATDDQVGMLGLGCKSALTYVNQFTVTAIKGGVKAQVSVGRNEDGTGTMEIVDTVSTSEPDGVEITVPIRNTSSFNTKAQNFFRFWGTDKVLIDGKAPVKPNFLAVTDSISILPNSEDYVVMGNVAYPVAYPHSLAKSRYKNYGVIAYVGIGDVHFTPSRESLHYTSKTLSTIALIQSNLEAAIVPAINKAIEGASDHSEALSLARNWAPIIGKRINAFTYQGVPIPNEIPFHGSGTIWTTGQARRSTYTHTSLEVHALNNNLLIVTGFVSNLTSNHRAKTRQWFENAGLSVKRVVFVDKMFGDPWTAKAEVIDWSVVKKEVLPSNGSGRSYGARKIAGSFQVFDGYWVEKTDLKANDKIAYVDHKNREYYDDVALYLTKVDPSYKIVAVAANRLEKFKRDFTNATPLTALVQKMVESAKDALTDDDKRYYGYDNGMATSLNRLSPDQIDDPRFAAFLNVQHGGSADNRAKWQSARKIARKVGVLVDTPVIASDTSFLNEYPLLTTCLNGGYAYRSFDKDHMYIYLNAVYATKKDI